MKKCANCKEYPSYLVKRAGVRPVTYCQKCLPSHLTTRALHGEFPLDPVPEPAALKKKKTKVAPEPEIVAEVVEEVAVVEEPAADENL
jgi:hypothetical protein